MDIEKPIRLELIEALSPHFFCFEEVVLRHALLRARLIKADVVAFPRGGQLGGCGFAFETKVKTQFYDHSHYSEAIKQASDYVYAKVEADKRLNEFEGKFIHSSFVFPSPPFYANQSSIPAEAETQSSELLLASGAIHLALHFRVGRAYWEKSFPDRKFVLAFGRNDVWNSRDGFVKRGDGLLQQKRRLGSKKVDFISELTGNPSEF